MNALIVIDMQNDFITGSLGNKECREVVKEVVNVCKEFKEKGDIFFTMDSYDNNYLNTNEGKKLPIPHCIKGSKGWEIINELNDFTNKDRVIEKNTFGSLKLKDYLANYENLYLVGVCTDICVISNATILKAAYPEKEIYIISKACAGVSPSSHNNALKAMEAIQINII